MFRILSIAAMLAAAGCASAVYDSLERRGIDARSVLQSRVVEAQTDASAAAAGIEAAVSALVATRGLEGAPLARQIDAARANAQAAAVAAQDVRLSTETAGAAGARYFREWEEEIGLYETEAERAAAAARLDSQAKALADLSASLRAAGLRLSPALVLVNDEIAVLRKNPTSGVVVTSRAARIDAAARAAAEAAVSLRAAASEADRFLAALKSGG